MSTDDPSAAVRGSEFSAELGPPPVGALTNGEVAMLRAWAQDYAAQKVAAEMESSRSFYEKFAHAVREYAESCAVDLENEFGVGRSLEELIADGDMPEVWHMAVAILRA